MKKNKIQKKLTLNKETVADLENGEMKAVKGGIGCTAWDTCFTVPNSRCHDTFKCL